MSKRPIKYWNIFAWKKKKKEKKIGKKTVEKKVPSHGKEIGFQGTDLSSFTAFKLTMETIMTKAQKYW